MLFTLFSAGLPTVYLVAILIAYIAVLILSLGSHEFAHAFTAYRNGDHTAKNMGRMSMNPFKHFNTYGFVCLLVLGFGWAEPVPVNPYYFNRGRKSMFQVAISGIMANLILALFFSMIFGMLHIFAFDFLMSEGFWSALVYYIVMYGININLSLAVFNLLPFYPLDGSKILELMLKPENSFLQFLQRYSTMILLALLLFGVISFIINIAIVFLGEGMILMWSWFFNLFL